MHGLPTLITDLALITICAGVITLLFKWLKQPVVLGYVLAGILAGPHFDFLPTVVDKENITIWADIGVIFLLFGLGLEFSFKKIVNVGKAAMITANANIFFMLFVGYNTGLFLGWTPMDSLFLGGMISMSSTTIIIKAFEELNLKKERFTELVFGVLVVEDLVGILLLVLLPTIALSNSVDGGQLAISTGKLVFFLVLCFIIGIYIVPTLIKKVCRYLNDEMLLLTSVALCLGMVVLATSSGFSSALGAFIMGSILAESTIVHRIENVLKPVKDFFGAVFFVSVGMMVNPAMFIEYWAPILAITIVVMTGKVAFSCCGFLVSGEPLKVAILGGFSLAQVGEFAFIIAALGMSLGVISDYVYPIIVAVSVLTTFTTPLMIKSAIPFYNYLNKILPNKWLKFIARNTTTTPQSSTEANMWKKLFKNYFLRVFLFSIVLIGIMNVLSHFVQPITREYIPGLTGRFFLTAFALILMGPFLYGLLISKKKVLQMYLELWMIRKTNRIPLILLISFRLTIVILFIMTAIHHYGTTNPYITTCLIAVSILTLSKSKWFLGQYLKIETQFLVNLNREQVETIKSPDSDEKESIFDEKSWLDSSLFVVSEFQIKPESTYAGMSIKDTGFQETYAINIFKIMRGKHELNVPRGSDVLAADDILLIVAPENQMKAFKAAVKEKGLISKTIADSNKKTVSLNQYMVDETFHFDTEETPVLCCAFPLKKDSSLIGQSILDSQIRGAHDCVVIGVERKSSLFINPEMDFVFKAGDVVWILGAQEKVGPQIVKQLELTKPLPA